MAAGKQQLRILAVEDDAGDTRLLRYHLAGDNPYFQSIYLEVTESLAGALQILEKAAFDAVLMDLNVTDSQGLGTFTQLHEIHPSLPIVILTGLNDEGVAISAVKAGAQDYLPKAELSKFKLLKTLSFAIERANLLQEAIASQQAARKASQYKSEFLAHMSHEIRTPMNGVIGMTSLLAETPLSTEQTQYVETIRKSGQHLLSLINDILDLSKIEAGKMQLEPALFNIRRIVEETLDLYAEMAHSKGLILANIVAPTLPSDMVGDDSRLRQILGNLISNAIKFTSSGQITVYAWPEAPGEILADDPIRSRNTVHFKVCDTGTGIHADHCQQLFQPFHQIKGHPKNVISGTGLGLAICKRLVEMMGGTIGVESELGQGSNFWFSVPFEKAIPRRSSRVDLTGKHVLLVSPDAGTAKILQEQLTLRGLRFQTFDTVEAATDALGRSPKGPDGFDLILWDMSKGSDEATMAKSLPLQSRQGPAVPVLLLLPPNASADYSDQVFGLKMPLKQASLYEQLANIFTEPHLRPAARIAELSEQPIPRKPPEKAARQRILIVDDSIVNQQVAANIVGNLGYPSDCVANGREAVKAVETGSYALVLMDCQMPEMDGFEATQCIRAMSPDKCSIPILAATANALPDYAKLCFAAGMDGVLVKPIVLNDLRQVLGQWLGSVESQAKLEKETFGSRRPSSPTSKVIDTRIMDGFFLSTNRERAGAFVDELIDIFLDVVPPIIAQIQEAVAARDAKALTRYAHKLKGTSRNLGACDLASSCENLEALGDQNKVEGAADLAQGLTQQFEEAREVLLSRYRSSTASKTLD